MSIRRKVNRLLILFFLLLFITCPDLRLKEMKIITKKLNLYLDSILRKEDIKTLIIKKLSKNVSELGKLGT